MRPFFMSLVSNSNHWLFISSTGGLSAGRKDTSNACFLTTQMIKLFDLQKIREQNYISDF